jgi:hypothetical protein
MLKPMPSPGDRFVQVSGDHFRRVRTNPGAAYDARGGLGGLIPAEYGRRAANKLTCGPAMAFDLTLPEQDDQDVNARQAELDEADAATETSIKSVVDWCKQNLSEKDVTKLVNELLDSKGAQDEPPDFRGRPRTGGTMSAMDSARVGE